MTVPQFQDFPMADRDREWDGDEAEKRVRKWADAQDEPNAKYREAHLWYDGDDPDNFTSYKLPIADVINGELKAVPHAIFAAGNVLQGARGGVNIPDDEKERVMTHLGKYYGKMGETPPWEK